MASKGHEPMKRVFAYVVAVLGTGILATALSTQFVLKDLAGLGVAMPVSVWVETTLQDVIGMGPLYTPLIAIGFLIAFAAAALVTRAMPGARVLVFAAAGGVALATILVGAETAFFNLQIISGARNMDGLIAQIAAGALGGWLYAKLSAMTSA